MTQRHFESRFEASRDTYEWNRVNQWEALVVGVADSATRTRALRRFQHEKDFSPLS